MAPPSLRDALRFWWKLGWISFGGTAAHLAIMHSELVEKRGWIESEQFFHALSHCLLLPGPEAQQLAIYIGWKLHGKLGGFLAGTLFVLPSTAILLGLSLLYAKYGTIWWISLLFRILKPVVVALVLRALFQISRRALRSRLQWLTAVVSFLALIFLHITLPWIMAAIVATGALAALMQNLGGRSGSAGATEPLEHRPCRERRRILRIVLGCAIVGAIPFLLLALFGRDLSFWILLSSFFTRTAFVTIGGSYTVIPYVAQIAVTKFTWLSHAQMLDGFALAETTPGPLIIVVGYVGFMAGFHHFHGSILMGAIALLVTVFYTFLPCFLFIFIGAPWIARASDGRWFRLVLKLVTAAVVAAILQLTIFLVRGVITPASATGANLGSAACVIGTLLLIHFYSQRRSQKASPHSTVQARSES